LAEGEKTEKATPKKRRDERKKGHVMLSKDAVAVASLAGSVLMLRLTFSSAGEALGQFMRYCLTMAQDRTITAVPKEVLIQGIIVLARVAGPLLGVTILMTLIATMAQTRMLVSFELIKPKFDKINPLNGFKNLFSLKNLVEVLKNIVKISILLYIVYTSLRDIMNVAERYMYAEIPGACSHIFNTIFLMLLKVLLAFLVIAAADFLYQWWDFERQMKMTKQEIKEEYKQTEGDPQVKGRIKQLQRQMSQARMMQQVPGADVVLRNPTHVAVALRYRPGVDAAPVVLAKGLDYLALKIVEVAEQNDVVILENKPLARALYAEAELYRMIPPDLYEAVAEVMVYLYKMDRIKAPADVAEELAEEQGPEPA
jgi:flagellar biosynthetic protein FlhB